MLLPFVTSSYEYNANLFRYSVVLISAKKDSALNENKAVVFSALISMATDV